MLEKLAPIKRWLTSVLGEAPGAYFVAALWVLTSLLVLATMGQISPLMSGGGSRLDVFDVFLPLALLATLGHRFVTRSESASRRIVLTGLTLALAVIAYLAPSNLLFLPRLLGLDVPGHVTRLAVGAWPLAAFAAVWGLTLTRRPNPPIGLRLIVIGMLAGALMSIVLAYPAYGLIFNTFNLGVSYAGSAFHVVALLGGFVAVLIWLAAGPAAVLWIRPQSRGGRLLVGATAGVLAGGIAFGLLGAPLGGVWAQSPLYGFALSREGYESGEWVLKLALAVLNIFPISLGLMWVSVGGGAIVGGVTVWFTPGRARSAPAANAADVLYELATALGAPLILALSGVAAVVILYLLPQAIQNIFNAYGFLPRWPTTWLQPAFTIQYLLALIVFQGLGLIAVYRSYRPLAARASRATASLETTFYVLAFVGAALHLMLFSIAEAVYGNPIVLALALVNLGLGLEIVLAFRWARKNVTPPEAGPTDAPIPSGWTGAGMVAGLLVGMLLFQFIGLSLSLVLISTPIIAPLAELKAPPGVAWLEETLFEPLFTIAPIVLTVLALWSMGTGFSVNASNPIFFRPVWDPNAGILRAARQRFEAAWQRIPRLVLDVLAVALALILAWTTREALTVVVVSLLAALIVLHRRWERPPWAIAALAFVIVVLCVAGLTLGGVFTDARPARLMYLLLGPASVLALRALTAYVPEHQHTRTRLTAFVGLAVAVGVLSYANQARVIREGGVSRYDGQQWEAFDSTNSLLGVRLNYALHQDSHGRLWFGSGPIAITYDAQFDRWQRYLLRSVTGGESLTAFSDTSLESRLLFAEDRQGRLWVASGDTFGQLDPALTARTDYVREPGMFVAGPLLPTTSACGQGVIQIWDLNGNLQTLILDPEGRLITGADVSPDGAYVVAANGTRTAKVWDTRTGEVIVRLEGHTNLVNMATFSPDGTLIATASNDKTVKLWDAQTGNLIATMSNTVNVNRAVFNSDGTQILAAGDGLETPIWDVQTGERIAALEQSGTVKGARFSPDGTRVVTVNGTELAHLWDARTGQSIAELIPDWVSPGEVDMAEFSPDGNLIATAGPDEIARVWDARTGHLVMTFNGHTRKVTAIAFSPDGTQIATASLDGAARLWQANTGELLATFDDDAAGLYQVEFTADETQLVTCDRDNREQVWDVGTGQLLTTLPSHVKWLEVSGLTPDRQHILVAGCIPKGGYQTLSLNSSVTDMTLDNDGNLWLATAGEGVYRIDANRQLENMTWEHFSSSNIANLSDNIRSLYIDQTGNLWAVTDKGLNVFDGVGWGRPLGPTALSQSAEVTFVEDSAGQLWAGATGGLYQWDGEAWTAASEWPEGLDATTLIEDSAGNLWAGTAEGALLFDSVAWKEIVPDVAVTTIVEDPSGKMWVGAQSGLFRFDPATGKTDSFTSANSGLATDAIQGLLVDAEGEIWASTFTVERIPGSPWAGLAAAVLFFGYLTVQTYRSYDRAPESRARRLNRQIEESPNSLYLAVYALLANTPDAPHILTQLADHRAKADDAVSAEVIRAIVALTTEPRTSLAANLNRSVAALEADAARAGTLGHLHNLLAKCLVARLIADITGLELSVDPGPEAGSVALRARDVTVAGLPPFARTGMAEAWRTLEKVGTVLRKYQEVDTAADRLSFLAEALSAVEAAVTAAQAVKPPEGRVMSAIASQWRAIVDYEINLISGRAELRLELRTRQARRAEQITVALRLQNAGRATAENVTVTLLPGEGFTLDGDSRVTLDRLPSGRSQPVEFTICPAPVASARIACRVTWDDRMGADNEIQFADALRFYEVSESFKRIPNPYIVGHPVKSPEMFQGRADIFEFIRDNLSGPTQDRTIVLHGQRRTGKTSILYQLVLGKLGAGFLPVLIDMQEVALLINGAADFLNEVAYQLARAIRKAGLALEPPDEAAFAAAPTRTFSRFLDAVEDTLGERKAVLIFDEFELIEGKIAEGKLEADLLNYFRSLIQHRHRLVFIFTGTHRLEEMSHDYWSILFNLALYRRVSFLTPADVAKLIRQPVAGALDVDALAVEKIIALTRGHAYFTQLICWALVNHCNANERNYATLNDVNDALQEILASGEAHFAYIWQQADATERLALAAVAHTIRPGKDWARPAEILETLAEGGAQMSQAALVDVLDRLTRQDVLESASDGALRYRFQIEVLRLWVEATKSVTALVERGR